LRLTKVLRLPEFLHYFSALTAKMSREAPLVHFVTGNPRKFAEAEAILGNDVYLRQYFIELPEIQDKCRSAATAV
jgi:threonine synthase